MPLLNTKNRQYVIMSRLTGFPLGPKGHTAAGAPAIEQQDLKDKSPWLEPMLDPAPLKSSTNGTHHVYLFLNDGRIQGYWDIAQGSTQPGAGLVLFPWNNAPNQRFRFMHAFDDYYYIKSESSGLVLEVPSAAAWAGVRQTHPRDGQSDQQLFRVVAKAGGTAYADIKSFQQYSNVLREVVLALPGLLPYKGVGVFKLVLGLLWPDGHDKDFWNQMTQYVEQRIQAVLVAERMTALDQSLTGLRKNMLEIARLDHPEETDPEKQQENLEAKITSLIATISYSTGEEAKFLRPEAGLHGVAVLPWLVSWCSLKLLLRRELVRAYEERQHLLPANAAVPTELADVRDDALQNLRDDLKLFGEEVENSRQRAVTWRQDCVKGEYQDFGDRVRYMATDTYDNWKMGREWSSSSSSGCTDGDKTDTYNHHAEDMRFRKNQVAAQFAASLDGVLAPARLWPYLDPANPLPAEALTVQVSVNEFGGRPGYTAFPAHLGQLTKVVLWSPDNGNPHSFVCGLRLEYADFQATYGTESGHWDELTLRSGEQIVNVCGYQRDLVYQLTFETSHGRTLTMGQRTPETREHQRIGYFEAGLDDVLNARLMGISGNDAGNFFPTLNFHWEYTIKEAAKA